MKLCWLTDTHLDVLSSEQRQAYYQQIATQPADAVVLSGDIADARVLTQVLVEMLAVVKKTTYFVIGNHDYYYADVKQVRENLKTLCGQEKQLIWLTISDALPLGNQAAILGVDGWADARYGNYTESTVTLRDSIYIEDLKLASSAGRQALKNKMQQLADHDVALLEEKLQAVLKTAVKELLVVTHLPPFAEACYYQNELSDEFYLPFFATKSLGDKLLQYAGQYPQVMFSVICGHTHTQKIYQPLANLSVLVGKAKTGAPEIQRLISIDDTPLT